MSDIDDNIMELIVHWYADGIIDKNDAERMLANISADIVWDDFLKYCEKAKNETNND